MTEQLADWSRRFYAGPGGKPLLFYVVFGAFPQVPALSREEYRSNGVFPGLQLAHYERSTHPGVLDQFQTGYLWDEVRRLQPGLAHVVGAAGECMILRGELEDQSNLNYLRDSVGLLTFLLDHGGAALYDPQKLQWWEPAEWKGRLFEPGMAMPRNHVVVLTSEEPEAPSLTWFHSRGMRKFGRPDLSAHRVAPRYRTGVIDVFERFIEFQAFGGIIQEGQEIRMRTLPGGMICSHAGDPDDPDFNNVHVEITPPGGEEPDS